MSEPDLNLLFALDALLVEQSVAGAARRIGLSASAMSRTLGRLREVTGDPLLVRAGRQMVLTPYAESIKEQTKNVVLEARALLKPVVSKLDVARLERTFTIRANDGFVEVYGALLIAAAAQVAPSVRLRFAPKAEKSARFLREGLVDIEIGVLGEMGPEIRLQALFRDRFVAVVRKLHPLANKKIVSPEDYIAFGHVVASRRGQARGPVDKGLAELDLERDIAAMVPSFPAVLAVVQASDLIGLIPASFIHKAMLGDNSSEAGSLAMFDLPIKTQGITISQMWHPRLDADPAHRWLRQLILRMCQQESTP